jgi:CRISPR-associated protein Csm5
MTTIVMTAIPLTPIHVGDGTTIGPESYVIDGQSLRRFEPTEALRSMTPGQVCGYLAAIDRGALREAERALRAAAPRAGAAIALAASSATELGRAQDASLTRSGDVHPMVRSAGRPYLPGSSIKGAIRTALANHFLGAQAGAAGDRWSHEEAMRAALALARHDTADDPLRFVSVGDVMLPEGSTRIDRVEIIVRPGRKEPPANKIQMHYERLLSGADTKGLKGVPTLKLELGIDESASDAAAEAMRARAGLRIGRRIDRAVLFDAVNRFHWQRWVADKDAYFSDPASLERMNAILRHVRVGAAMMDSKGPVGSQRYLLLRVGRFGHFESKSLDKIRRGYFPQRKGDRPGRPGEEGGTRSVVRIDGAPIPFGWLLAYETSAPAQSAP